MAANIKLASMTSAVLVIALVRPAAADESELLQACYRAVNAGAYDLACKLCETAVTDTTGPVRQGALINLARCEEARGRLVRARLNYRRVRADMPDDDARASGIDERIAALDPRIGQLRIDWSQSEGARLEIDDEVVAGQPQTMDIDPGERRAVIQLEGREPHELTLTVADGATAELAVTPGPAIVSPPPPEVTPTPSGGSGQQMAGFVVGGIGLLGLATFGVTGALVLDRQTTVDDLCPELDGTRRCTDARGVDAADEGNTLNVINAVALGVGVVGVTAGFLLLLTAPDESSASVRVDVGLEHASASLRGRF